MQRLIVLVLIWCGFNTLGEIMIKLGGRYLSEPAGWSDGLRIIGEVLRNPLVMAGVAVSAADLLLWIYILREGDLSVVAPLTAINYIFAIVAGCLVFGETLTIYRIVGIILICGGTFFITRQ